MSVERPSIDLCRSIANFDTENPKYKSSSFICIRYIAILLNVN